jgi:hypothetical protein
VNLPLGIVWFTLLIFGLSLGAGLLITLLGIPVLVGTGWLIRAAGSFERTRINLFLGTDFLGTTLRDPYRPPVEGTGWIARLLAIGKDPATWLDFLFLMLRLPMGIVTFTVVITAWSLAIGLLLSPISFLFGTFRLDIFFGLWVLHGPFAVMLATLSGVVMVFLAAWITRGLARLEALLASALLDASPEELHRRVTNLARSRARTMSASDQARRRLERDLHEGMSQ